MAKDDVKNQLEELREQMTDLAATREARRATRSQSDGEAMTVVQEEVTSERPGHGAHNQEFIAMWGEEMRRANPVALLAAFGLGFVAGCLLTR